MSTSVLVTCKKFGRRIAILAVLGLTPLAAEATSFTAGVVMEKMNAGDRYTFVAGIVEGLAMARYREDGKKPDGMNCIYSWFYDNHATLDNIYAAFKQYPDYQPGTVIDVMSRKTCS